MDSQTEAITYSDLVGCFRSRRRLARKDYEVYCDTVQAIGFRDVLECFLFFSGALSWKWVDALGRALPQQGVWSSLRGLSGDVLGWPFLYARLSRAVSFLGQQTEFRAVLGQGTSAVFLRTDHLFQLKSGGSVGHLRGVIVGLRGLGYGPHVVSSDRLMGVPEDAFFHLCEPVYQAGRNVPNFPEFLYSDQVVSFVGSRWERWAPAFIYQRYSLGNYSGVALKQRYRVPYVCEYNGSFVWMAREWGRKRLFHEKLVSRVELLNLRAADVVVVVSRPMKDELVARGVAGDKILVNPNGVDPERYSPGVDGGPVRARYGLDGKTVVGFIGTFGQWHGAEVLAEAFGRLLRTFPAYRDWVRLLMIGDGVRMPQVRAALEAYGVSEACVLTGMVPQEEGPAHLAACDVLVSPHVPNPDGSPFFGSPTKLFEYMAMGKGIVASDLDQIGEVLVHDRTGWLVRPGDAESLVQGLEVLIDDGARRDRLGRAAREDVAGKYTWREHTRKIVDMLKERCA